MTTIVAVADRMVSDSKITQERKDDTTYFEGPKLVRKGNALIGAAGDSHLGDKFVAWYGTKKKKPQGFGTNASFEALVLTPDGIYHFDEYLGRNKVNREWYAVGSGSFAAMGAMYAGATPEQAVEIACLVDNYSGLPLQILRLNDGTNGTT